MTTYRTPDHGEYPEYTKFSRYLAATCDVTWIPLLVAENRVRFYALSNLVEVKSPFDSGLDYCYPQPCTAITLWRPTIEIPIWELGYYKPGSKKSARGLNMNMSNVRLVLTLPAVAA